MATLYVLSILILTAMSAVGFVLQVKRSRRLREERTRAVLRKSTYSNLARKAQR